MFGDKLLMGFVSFVSPMLGLGLEVLRWQGSTIYLTFFSWETIIQFLGLLEGLLKEATIVLLACNAP